MRTGNGGKCDATEKPAPPCVAPPDGVLSPFPWCRDNRVFLVCAVHGSSCSRLGICEREQAVDRRDRALLTRRLGGRAAPARSSQPATPPGHAFAGKGGMQDALGVTRSGRALNPQKNQGCPAAPDDVSDLLGSGWGTRCLPRASVASAAGLDPSSSHVGPHALQQHLWCPADHHL